MDRTVHKLVHRASFQARLRDLSDQLGDPKDALERRAVEAFSAMVAVHQPAATLARRSLFSVITDRVNVQVDRHDLAKLREIDREHPIAWLPAHRSYLDMIYLENAVVGAGVSPSFILGGDNNDYFPLGAILRRTGTIFIRRTIKDDPVYRAALRSYLAHVVENGNNLCWSIEGGRTRTGKLRPPRYGALRYVADAVLATDGPDMVAVPVSVVYDQLAEVSAMTAEARGATKESEGLGWAIKFIKKQLGQDTTVRLSFGEPLHMRARLEALANEPKSKDKTVERFALEVCHRINRATPAHETAIVTFALLGVERALTLEEIQEAMTPLLAYLEKHPTVPHTLRGQTQVSGWLHSTLRELVDAGVLARFDGDEPVWYIADDQHLVAAFYRNTLIHLLVNRSIAELAFFMALRSGEEDLGPAIWEGCMKLRDLLKFEFFFSTRANFMDELYAEAALLDPRWRRPRDELGALSEPVVRDWLDLTKPHVAPVVLRPFLESYSVVADQLAKWPEPRHVDRKRLLDRCLAYGHQRVLQGRLHSPESVTLELFKTGLQLADHRGLLEGSGPEVVAARVAFADELRDAVDQLRALAEERR
ncbi:MAG: 1-acyl-sn-glycerol-3-phosphate acyltransferase [Myxococcota bacterium]